MPYFPLRFILSSRSPTVHVEKHKQVKHAGYDGGEEEGFFVEFPTEFLDVMFLLFGLGLVDFVGFLVLGLLGVLGHGGLLSCVDRIILF